MFLSDFAPRAVLAEWIRGDARVASTFTPTEPLHDPDVSSKIITFLRGTDVEDGVVSRRGFLGIFNLLGRAHRQEMTARVFEDFITGLENTDDNEIFANDLGDYNVILDQGEPLTVMQMSTLVVAGPGEWGEMPPWKLCPRSVLDWLRLSTNRGRPELAARVDVLKSYVDFDE